MKIAMFGHKRIPSRQGGVEVAVTEISTRMASSGHAVTCYNRGGKPGKYHGVSLIPAPALPGKGLAAVSSGFFAAMAAGLGDSDVVHIHAEGPAFWCWIPKLLGKRVIVTIHGLDWQREKWAGSCGRNFIRAGEQTAVRFADQIIVLSRNAQRYFKDMYGRETVFIPNGVADPQNQRAKEIRRFGLDKDNYLLFLGRLVPEKGVHYLIEAFRGLRTEKKLVIAGASSNTDFYVSRLKKLAAGDERILFTGFVEGRLLQELYSNAYLYVLPSDLEGMPLSLLEAMRYGNCCVVSDIPECTEVAGKQGIVFPRGNVNALRQCLQGLCDAPEAVNKIRKAKPSLPGWDDVVKKTLELYHEDFADQ